MQVQIAAGFMISVSLIGAGKVRGGEGPEAALTRLGLERAGSLYTLVCEADVQQKLSEVQPLFKDYAAAYALTLDIQFAAARAKEMDDLIIELDHDIETLNVELGYRPGRPNNVQRDYYNGLKLQRDDLVLKRNEARTEARRLRSLPIGERAKQAAKADFERRRKACRPALVELRLLVESTDAKYGELAKNSQAQDAVAAVGRTTKSKLKIGPSPKYRNAAQEVVKFQKYLDSPATMIAANPKPKSKKKNRPKSDD